VSGDDDKILVVLPHDRGLEDAECADIGDELGVGVIATGSAPGIVGVRFEIAWI
jgi:hypothetical protein